MWTCENNAKARASHADAVGDDTCRFQDVEHFTDAETLARMNKVKVTGGCKRFNQWLSIGRKGKIPTKAWCTRHLKECKP